MSCNNRTPVVLCLTLMLLHCLCTAVMNIYQVITNVRFNVSVSIDVTKAECCLYWTRILILVLTSCCQSLSLSFSIILTSVPSLPSVSWCCMPVCLAGEWGPTGEQVRGVRAVFIGTQVSSGVLGCLDNTWGPCSLVWQLQKHLQTHPNTSAHGSYSRHTSEQRTNLCTYKQTDLKTVLLLIIPSFTVAHILQSWQIADLTAFKFWLIC